MLTSSSIGQISQRCQERVAQHGHTHKGVYLGSHQPAASAQSAVSSQAVPGGRGCRKESLAHQHLYTNLVRARLCPLACNPLHCLMEGTVSGSTTALPPAHSQARPGQGWGDGTGQGWLLVVGRKNASCLGTDKSVGVSCAFAAREQPPVTLHQCIYYLTGGGQHLSSVPAGLWKEQIASCLSLHDKQCGCPMSCAADALSSGRCSRIRATCQQRCLSFPAAVAAGCHADCGDLPCSASLAGGCPNSKQTLPVAAGNKVDPEIPELWEVGFNVINCNRRRGQIIGAKVSL